MNMSSQLSVCECRSACVNASYMSISEHAQVFFIDEYKLTDFCV